MLGPDVIMPPELLTRYLDKHHCKKLRTLSDGLNNYGEVVLVEDDKGVQFALKMIPREKYKKGDYEIASRLNHVNIMSTYSMEKVDNYYFILTEFVRDGGLDGYLKAQKKKNLKPDPGIAVGIITQILNAIDYLHTKCKNKILHRDLKSANILFDGHPKAGAPNGGVIVKVCDFGLSREIINTMASTVCGTMAYKAPEIQLQALSGGVYDEKADTWSIGVLLYELSTYRYPYSSMGLTASDTKRVLERPKTMEGAEWDRIWAATSALLRIPPKERASCAEALHLLNGDNSDGNNPEKIERASVSPSPSPSSSPPASPSQSPGPSRSSVTSPTLSPPPAGLARTSTGSSTGTSTGTGTNTGTIAIARTTSTSTGTGTRLSSSSLAPVDPRTSPTSTGPLQSRFTSKPATTTTPATTASPAASPAASPPPASARGLGLGSPGSASSLASSSTAPAPTASKSDTLKKESSTPKIEPKIEPSGRGPKKESSEPKKEKENEKEKEKEAEASKKKQTKEVGVSASSSSSSSSPVAASPSAPTVGSRKFKIVYTSKEINQSYYEISCGGESVLDLVNAFKADSNEYFSKYDYTACYCSAGKDEFYRCNSAFPLSGLPHDAVVFIENFPSRFCAGTKSVKHSCFAVARIRSAAKAMVPVPIGKTPTPFFIPFLLEDAAGGKITANTVKDFLTKLLGAEFVSSTEVVVRYKTGDSPTLKSVPPKGIEYTAVEPILYVDLL